MSKASSKLADSVRKVKAHENKPETVLPAARASKVHSTVKPSRILPDSMQPNRVWPD